MRFRLRYTIVRDEKQLKNRIPIPTKPRGRLASCPSQTTTPFPIPTTQSHSTAASSPRLHHPVDIDPSSAVDIDPLSAVDVDPSSAVDVDPSSVVDTPMMSDDPDFYPRP